MQIILVIVTDLFFAVKVSTAAQRAGREVKFAGSAEEAIRLARELHPVLLVADLHCREVDCLEVVRTLRADPALGSIPALGFVAHVQEEVKRAALAAGFTKVVARSTFSDKTQELLSGEPGL